MLVTCLLYFLLIHLSLPLFISSLPSLIPYTVLPSRPWLSLNICPPFNFSPIHSFLFQIRLFLFPFHSLLPSPSLPFIHSHFLASHPLYYIFFSPLFPFCFHPHFLSPVPYIVHHLSLYNTHTLYILLILIFNSLLCLPQPSSSLHIFTFSSLIYRFAIFVFLNLHYLFISPPLRFHLPLTPLQSLFFLTFVILTHFLNSLIVIFHPLLYISYPPHSSHSSPFSCTPRSHLTLFWHLTHLLHSSSPSIPSYSLPIQLPLTTASLLLYIFYTSTILFPILSPSLPLPPFSSRLLATPSLT